jgi:hypothetical protein
MPSSTARRGPRFGRAGPGATKGSGASARSISRQEDASARRRRSSTLSRRFERFEHAHVEPRRPADSVFVEHLDAYIAGVDDACEVDRSAVRGTRG